MQRHAAEGMNNPEHVALAASPRLGGAYHLSVGLRLGRRHAGIAIPLHLPMGQSPKMVAFHATKHERRMPRLWLVHLRLQDTQRFLFLAAKGLREGLECTEIARRYPVHEAPQILDPVFDRRAGHAEHE